LMLSYINDLKH